MRILLASTHGAGHFGPLVPFADACLRQGHEILVAGPPTLDPRGYPFRAGASPPEDVLRAVWDSMPRQPPGQGDAVVVGEIFAGLNVQAMLAPLEEAIGDWRPDLVLREPNEYASAIAAERAGVPHVRVGIGLSFVEEAALVIASPSLEDVEPGITAAIARSRYVTCFPATLDPPPFAVDRYRAVESEAPAAPLPDWWGGDDRPLVYVTFGSVAAGLPFAVPVFRAALEALADLPVRVLLTLGRELDVGPVPGNVHVEQWVPQADVLEHAAAVICHGGSGTTLGALGAGKPLVILPLFADQPPNAVRVATVGAGVVSTLATLRRSVERVLEDERYRCGAEALADEMRRLPPADEFLSTG
jgi:UDP:flavonoid glycosyltransferase YjiC (YdhE family)